MSTVAMRRDGAIRTRNKPDLLTPPYQPIDEKAQAGGYASIDAATALIPAAQLGTGSPTSAKALLGDQSWGDVATQGELDAEATTRATADTTLQTNITSEATSRASADTTLQTNITAEASTRATADTTEATARAAADSSEASTRATADSSEATARAAADALLQPLSGKDASGGYAGLTSGTFTPTLSFGGGSTGITYAVQVGFWRLIGGEMCIDLYIVLSNKGSSTGAAVIGGLPVASHNTANRYIGVDVPRYENITASGHIAGHIAPNTQVIPVYNIVSGGGAVALTDTAFTNSSEFMLSFRYPT